MKKKILAVAMIVICLAIAAYGTLAYFTYEETATNVIVAGNIKVAIRQHTVNQSGEVVADDAAMDILPGSTVSKTVEVENVGKNAAWIRISVSKAIELADGVEGAVDLSLIGLDLNTQDWTERDGYYYYNVALEPGQTTQSLFTQVVFAENMGNLYQSSKAYITVTLQAVQVANNGATVFEAAGWPENQQ